MSFKLTWFGHAAIGIEVDETQLLIDPFLSENPVASIQPDKVQADYILISHGHGDHIGDAVEIASRTNALVISSFEVASWFKNQGLDAHAQHIGGGYHHPFGYLKLTIAHHGSALPDGSYGGNPTGVTTTISNIEEVIGTDFDDIFAVYDDQSPDHIAALSVFNVGAGNAWNGDHRSWL